MKINFESKNDFNDFKAELRNRLKERNARDIEIQGYKHASVMMLLMNKENSPYVLLTKRTYNVSSHKGQVSFPGGAFDHGDKDYLATAYRETFEEVGISPEKIEYIGRFDDYISISGFRVSCFIGAIEYPYEYKLNRKEIESHLEAPLTLFVNQEYDRYEYFNHNGLNYKVYYYLYKGYEIWGLTARILTDFGKDVVSG